MYSLKRISALLLTVALIFTCLPAALATGLPACTCDTACTILRQNGQCDRCSVDGFTLSNCGKYIPPQSEDTDEEASEAASEESSEEASEEISEETSEETAEILFTEIPAGIAAGISEEAVVNATAGETDQADPPGKSEAVLAVETLIAPLSGLWADIQATWDEEEETWDETLYSGFCTAATEAWNAYNALSDDDKAQVSQEAYASLLENYGRVPSTMDGFGVSLWFTLPAELASEGNGLILWLNGIARNEPTVNVIDDLICAATDVIKITNIPSGYGISVHVPTDDVYVTTTAVADGYEFHPVVGRHHVIELVELPPHTCSGISNGVSEAAFLSSSLPTAGSYYLAGDMTEAVTISSGTVSLCLNGKSLTGLVTVAEGAALVICDCSSPSTGTISTILATGSMESNANGSTITCHSGTIGRIYSNGYLKLTGVDTSKLYPVLDCTAVSDADRFDFSGDLVQFNGKTYVHYGATITMTVKDSDDQIVTHYYVKYRTLSGKEDDPSPIGNKIKPLMTQSSYVKIIYISTQTFHTTVTLNVPVGQMVTFLAEGKGNGTTTVGPQDFYPNFTPADGSSGGEPGGYPTPGDTIVWNISENPLDIKGQRTEVTATVTPGLNYFEPKTVTAILVPEAAEYTITIPSETIVLPRDHANQSIKVETNDPNQPYTGKLSVKLSGECVYNEPGMGPTEYGAFALGLSDDYFRYEITLGNVAMANRTEKTFNYADYANGLPLVFSLDESQAKYAGEYTGTLTFTVALTE